MVAIRDSRAHTLQIAPAVVLLRTVEVGGGEVHVHRAALALGAAARPPCQLRENLGG